MTRTQGHIIRLSWKEKWIVIGGMKGNADLKIYLEDSDAEWFDKRYNQLEYYLKKQLPVSFCIKVDEKGIDVDLTSFKDLMPSEKSDVDWKHK